MAQLAQRVAQSRRKGPQTRLVIGAIVAVAAIVYLVFSGIHGATVYSLTIAELKGKGQMMVGQGARVAGTLDGQSVSWDAQALLLRFQIKDGGESLDVVYKGVKPDMFNDEAEAIVEGKLLSDGTFEATKLMLKCPSKYESGTPVYEATPPRGR